MNLPDADVEETSMSNSATEENGECTPGKLSCQGTSPTFCDESGHLQINPGCMFVCDNGICIGECSPGARRCLDRDMEYCENTAMWRVVDTCPINCKQNVCDEAW